MAIKIQINLRLPPDLLEELKNQADKEKRSTNNMIEIAIEEYIQKRKKEEENKEKT